jgi:membrane fusion protein, multidrug efflux system
MYVRARIKQGIDSDAIAVPQQAVHRSNDGRAQVWLVGQDEKVVLQPVEVGPVVEGQWVIREGLKAGDRVVAEGFQKIVAGTKVATVPYETTTMAAAGAGHAPQPASTEQR